MNKWAGTGRLTKDPEVKNTTTGKTVASFILAVDRRFKNADGQKEADFIPVIFWGKQAELVGQHLSKGSKIGVVGRIATRSYDGQDGQRRYVMEIIGDELEFLDNKKNGSSANYQNNGGNFSEAILDDDFLTMAEDDDPFPF